MPTLNDLNHAYNRGYGDARRGRPALTVAWVGDELEQYKQGYEEGSKTKGSESKRSSEESQ